MSLTGRAPGDLWESVRSSRPATVEQLVEDSKRRREAYRGGLQRIQHAAVQFAWVAGPMFLIFNVPRILFGRKKKRPPPPEAARIVPAARPGMGQQAPQKAEDQKAYLAELMKQREEYLRKVQEAQLKAKLEARKAFLERQAQEEAAKAAQAGKPAAAPAAGSAPGSTPAPAAKPKGLSGGLPAKPGSQTPAAAAAAPAAPAAAAVATGGAGPRGLGGSGGLLPRGGLPARPSPAPTTVIEELPPSPKASEPKGMGKGLSLAPRKTATPTKPKPPPVGFGSKPAGLRGGLPARGSRAPPPPADDDDDEWEEDDGTAEEELEEPGPAPSQQAAPPSTPQPAAAPADPIKGFRFPGATADAVPLPDGSGWLVRRKMAADNSCLFNAVDYVKYGYQDSAGPAHAANQYGMQLRLVVANQVEDHPDKYNDAFLSMPNRQYVNWIQDPSNWGGGIELAVLAEHFKMEIGALNVSSKTCHVFGEESGYTQRALVIYDGNHYDAIAIASSPSAPQLKDEALFDPTSPHGKSVMAAAQKMVELSWQAKNIRSFFGGSG